MSITTYTELQTAVANWLGRDDLTSRIPEFITGGETRLYDDVKILELATVTTASLSSGDTDYTLSSTFNELASPPMLTDASGNKYLLDPKPPAIVQYNYGETITARPTEYAIIGSKMYFNNTVDATYTLTLTIFDRPFLSSSVATNWLIDNYPMALLYAALLEADAYIENNNTPYASLYKEQVDRILHYNDGSRIPFWTNKETKARENAATATKQQ